MFEAERRLVDYTYAADKDLNTSCSGCHSMGRVISERRTKDEWVGADDHAPLLLSGYRRRHRADSAAAARPEAAGGAAPAVVATGAVAKDAATRASHTTSPGTLHDARFHSMSPEWAAWSAAMRTPRLAGRWALAGYQIAARDRSTASSRSPIGPTCRTASPRTASFTYTKTGETFTRKAARSSTPASNGAGDRLTRRTIPARGARSPSSSATARRSRGAGSPARYDETGIDVTLRRVATDPVVIGHRRQLAEDIDIGSARAHLRRQSAGAGVAPLTSTSVRA